MAANEQNILGRVLLISKAVYSDMWKSSPPENPVAVLDLLSAALSHIESGDIPKNLLKKLKRGIKSQNRNFYPEVKQYFALFYPTLEFDIEKARKHIPAMIFGNDKICEKIIKGEHDNAKSMCSAMASYPGFIFGEFEELSDEQFYDLVFGYYPKLFEEEFMDEMRDLFIGEK